MDNFRLGYDTYNLRMRRALEGRGSHSFQHYKAAGEAFAAPSLVVFALALCGGFENVVQPANLRSQEAGDLPMERWGAWRKTAEDLRAVAAQIRQCARSCGACFSSQHVSLTSLPRCGALGFALGYPGVAACYTRAGGGACPRTFSRSSSRGNSRSACYPCG